MDQRKVALVTRITLPLSVEDERLDILTWDTIGDMPALGDYDILILDVMDPTPIHRLDIRTFRKQLNPKVTVDILKSGGEIIVVGDPRLIIRNANEHLPFLSWTGLDLKWRDEQGDTVRPTKSNADLNLRNYVSHLKSWSYSLESATMPNNEIAKIMGTIEFQGVLQPAIKKKLFYVNRTGRGLISSIRLVLERREKDIYTNTLRDWDTIREYGSILFLPNISCDHITTLELILQDISNLTTSVSAPEWIDKIIVPGQQAIEDKIKKMEKDRDRVESELKETTIDLAIQRKPLRLLFDGGKSLEEAVGDCLERLGAQVIVPIDNTQADLLVGYPSLKSEFLFVVEVKSTEKETFNEKALNQIKLWREQVFETEDKEYKGLFIGNNAITVHPDARKTIPFGDQLVRHLVFRGFVAVLTADLFLLDALASENKFEKELFWKDLFEAEGVFDIKTWIEKSASN